MNAEGEKRNAETLKMRGEYISMAERRAKPGSGSRYEVVREAPKSYGIPALKEILSQTPFVIVGGVATRLYMPERMTLDIDILVAQEYAETVEEELTIAGARKSGRLAIGGSTWKLADSSVLDVVILNMPWVEEAISHPVTAGDGLPYIDLPYLVLMKLCASRVQDIADISRMLGHAAEGDLERTRSVVMNYAPADVEDLESLIVLGRMEIEK